ncbi:MAG TPA: bifunctional shikimate kinase/3-dehydroquinate synthase [Candidatus Eisenbacteria bacterium]|nr:bifunctional shikimate kinase/3-dehydroquinate synthase [Candidatus Eisenbacteria bacterium]
MDAVIVGLPGSGKSAIGRRLAGRHGARFVDLDADIEAAAGMPVADIFAVEGETGFRARERAAIEALGPPDRGPELGRVIAPGGGAVVDPRNRWRLYRGRLPIWLDVRPEVLAQRLRRSPRVRPLVAGRDPVGALRQLAAARARFYAPSRRVNGVAEPEAVLGLVAAEVQNAATDTGTVLLRASTPGGAVVIGEGIAAPELATALRSLSARRAILISESGAWSAAGASLAAALTAEGWPVEHLLLPSGEDAKRMAVVEDAASQLSRWRVERGEPLVAIGGGAVGDTAGFVAAIYLRGVPLIQVPTTLVAQIDSSLGGKTGVDLPEGKNLVGAFHQPAAIVIDIALLGSLPERERRAGLAEAAKMAALGDERLFELLEEWGPAIAAGDPQAVESGALAELVERAAWAKIEVVTADEREAAGRIALNLGHSLGHAIEAAAGFTELRHGEAVAYGLRAACRIGLARGVTPAARVARIEALLDRLELGRGSLPYSPALVLDALAGDKKHAGGNLRWVLPTGSGYQVDEGVPDELVASVAADVLGGRTAGATLDAAGARS